MRLVFGMLIAAMVTVGFMGCETNRVPVVRAQPADNHAGHDHAE